MRFVPRYAINNFKMPLIHFRILDDQWLSAAIDPAGRASIQRDAHRPEQIALKPLHRNETQLFGSFIIFQDGREFAVG
jgi:hypothetical protein